MSDSVILDLNICEIFGYICAHRSAGKPSYARVSLDSRSKTDLFGKASLESVDDRICRIPPGHCIWVASSWRFRCVLTHFLPSLLITHGKAKTKSSANHTASPKCETLLYTVIKNFQSTHPNKNVRILRKPTVIILWHLWPKYTRRVEHGCQG